MIFFQGFTSYMSLPRQFSHFDYRNADMVKLWPVSCILLFQHLQRLEDKLIIKHIYEWIKLRKKICVLSMCPYTYPVHFTSVCGSCKFENY